jgi:hypothetical protein
MDRDATDRGNTSHRIVHAIERLSKGFGELGIQPHTAERLAVAYALKLEAVDWWKSRGYDMSHVPLVSDGEADRE